MKLLIIVSLSSTLLISCGIQEPEKVQELDSYTIEQFYNNKSIFGSSFSPDEQKLLVTSDESGIYNIYEMDLASGLTKPLTASTKESIFAVSYFPQDERTLYQSDKGGNEISHIYLRELDGKVRDLTSDSLAKAQFTGWARDEQSFFYLSTERDPRFLTYMRCHSQIGKLSGSTKMTII